MIKQCVVCGKSFQTNRDRQVTCGDLDCQYARHMEYLTEYSRKRRKTHRQEINDYNREWMRKYRAKQKAEAERRTKQINSFECDGYADRQKAKTLALAGKVQI